MENIRKVFVRFPFICYQNEKPSKTKKPSKREKIVHTIFNILPSLIQIHITIKLTTKCTGWGYYAKKKKKNCVQSVFQKRGSRMYWLNVHSPCGVFFSCFFCRTRVLMQTPRTYYMPRTTTLDYPFLLLNIIFWLTNITYNICEVLLNLFRYFFFIDVLLLLLLLYWK